MFKYTVEGEYIQGGKLSQSGFYEVSFVLSEKDKGLARSIIQNTLLHEKLLREVDNYKRWRTAQITDVSDAGKDEKPDASPKLEELAIKAAESGVVPSSLKAYPKAEDKEKKLQEAVDRKAKRDARNKKKTVKNSDTIDEGYID